MQETTVISRFLLNAFIQSASECIFSISKILKHDESSYGSYHQCVFVCVSLRWNVHFIETNTYFVWCLNVEWL